MRGKHKIFLIAFICFLLTAVLTYMQNTRIKSIEDYNSFLNEKENGCYISKKIAGINISVKFQPPQYMALKELQQNTEHAIWSATYKKQTGMMTFLMTIGPGERSSKDKRKSIMYEGVNNYQDYTQRVMATNFNMDQQIKLYTDNYVRNPVLCILENVYELSEDRRFVVIFTTNSENIDKDAEFTFTYSDPFFDMGEMQFHFKGADLRKSNEVKLFRS